MQGEIGWVFGPLTHTQWKTQSLAQMHDLFARIPCDRPCLVTGGKAVGEGAFQTPRKSSRRFLAMRGLEEEGVNHFLLAAVILLGVWVVVALEVPPHPPLFLVPHT